MDESNIKNLFLSLDSEKEKNKITKNLDQGTDLTDDEF
jgi:hypothetical protein